MKYKRQSGFTIVELLIVVVVIAILAAITIVSYNGITTRANASAAKSTAATFQKKAELFYSSSDRYPVDMTELSNPSEPHYLEGDGFGYLNATVVDSSNGKDTVRILKCAPSATDQQAITSSNITGLEIHYWDYAENEITSQPIKLGTGDCPTQDVGIL